MKSNIFKTFLFFILCFSTIAQDSYIKVPAIFSSKNQPKDVAKFYQGHADLSDEKYLKYVLNGTKFSFTLPFCPFMP